MSNYGPILGSLDSARQRREAQNENAARFATCFVRHVTTGTGSIRTGNMPFGVVFLEEPSMVTGVVLTQAPDGAYYKLPTVTVGVHRWETQPHPGIYVAPGTPDADKPKIYVGAHLFFEVQADPLRPPRTNGSNLADLQARYAKATGAERDSLLVLIREAQEALYLTANPAKASLLHHVQFSGLALKGPDLPAADVMRGALPTKMPRIG